jgi:DNA repair protein RecN (Recombination protein N)
MMVRSGRTRAAAAPLAGDERVREIARMLAGDAESPAALKHARELLR